MLEQVAHEHDEAVGPLKKQHEIKGFDETMMRPPGTGKKPPGGAGTPGIGQISTSDPVSVPGAVQYCTDSNTPGEPAAGTHTDHVHPTTTERPSHHRHKLIAQAHKSQPISDPQNGCSPERVDGFGSNHPHHSLLHTYM